jgi:hypothetical protein
MAGSWLANTQEWLWSNVEKVLQKEIGNLGS